MAGAESCINVGAHQCRPTVRGINRMVHGFLQKILLLGLLGVGCSLVRMLHINFFVTLFGLAVIIFMLSHLRSDCGINGEINYKKMIQGQLALIVFSGLSVWLISAGGIEGGWVFLMFTAPIFLSGTAFAILTFVVWAVDFRRIRKHPPYYNISVVINFLVWMLAAGYFIQQNWDLIVTLLTYEPPLSYSPPIHPEPQE